MDKSPTSSKSKNFLSSHLNKKDKKAGCIIIGLIIFIIVIIILVIIFGIDLLTDKDEKDELKTNEGKNETIERTIPEEEDKTDIEEPSNQVSGEVIAVTGIKTDDDKINLWVLTKDFDSEGREKPLTGTIYIYNPIDKKVIKTISGSFNDIGSSFRFYNYKDKVWFIRSIDSWNTRSGNFLYVFDSETGDEILNSKTFVKKFEELSSGIQSLSFDNQLIGFKITAKDGRKYVYKIKDEKLISEKDWHGEKYKGQNKKLVHYYTLIPEPHSEGRMLLYSLLVPKFKIRERDFNDSYMWNSFLHAFYEKSAKEITPERVYFRGRLIYQDEDILLILHNTSIDSKSESLLTCLDLKGEELWEKPKSELFNAKLEIHHHVSRIDSTLLYKVKSKGVIALDYATGEELWSFDY